MAPRPLPGILEIEPYKGGEAATPGIAKPFKLSSNENALGASPAALAAYREAADTLALYPDGAHAALRRAIAAKYGLNPDRIVCTAGSDEVFQLLGRAYLGRGDAIVQSEHAFLVYRLVAQQAGADTISVPDRELCADVDGMLAAITPRTRIVFLANPNNPTGTYLPFEEVRRLHAGLPGDVLLVLDGAYAEFVRRNDYSSGLELAAEHDNVLMTRTFSKIHGLAALRVGWAYGPQTVIDALNRVRGPFNVSGPALAAAAAAIEDHAFQEQSATHNEHWLGWLSAEIGRLGYRLVPSVGNFLLIDFGSAEAAAHADAFLRSRGLILRAVKAYGLSTYLRLSVGSEEANRRVVEALAALKAP